MIARGAEGRRLALADRVDVNAVIAGPEPAHPQGHPHAPRRLDKCRGPDDVPLRVLELGLRRLGICGRGQARDQRPQQENEQSRHRPNSARAAASFSGMASRSSAVSASAFAPATRPARASGERAHSANSREWPGTPSGEMRM